MIYPCPHGVTRYCRLCEENRPPLNSAVLRRLNDTIAHARRIDPRRQSEKVQACLYFMRKIRIWIRAECKTQNCKPPQVGAVASR